MCVYVCTHHGCLVGETGSAHITTIQPSLQRVCTSIVPGWRILVYSHGNAPVTSACPQSHRNGAKSLELAPSFIQVSVMSRPLARCPRSLAPGAGRRLCAPEQPPFTCPSPFKAVPVRDPAHPQLVMLAKHPPRPVLRGCDSCWASSLAVLSFLSLACMVHKSACGGRKGSPGTAALPSPSRGQSHRSHGCGSEGPMGSGSWCTACLAAPGELRGIKNTSLQVLSTQRALSIARGAAVGSETWRSWVVLRRFQSMLGL